MKPEKNLLAFSGGGIRAAVFALGALIGIRKQEKAIGTGYNFNHASAISGGGLTLAALIGWMRAHQEPANGNPLQDDTKFEEFKQSVKQRLLKKGLWHYIVWNRKFYAGGTLLLLLSTAVYTVFNCLISGSAAALAPLIIGHTALWQFLYTFTLISLLAVALRYKCIKYWVLFACGLGSIIVLWFNEPALFNQEPWFLGPEINVFGCLGMLLWRVLVALVIMLSGLIILPLTGNKRHAIEVILKQILFDTTGQKSGHDLTYAAVKREDVIIEPIVSATNFIDNRLVIFLTDRIHYIGQGWYPWDQNKKLNNLAAVANFTCNFPCVFSPSRINLKHGQRRAALNLLDGGVLDNLGLWGPLFTSDIHNPFQKVLSIDASLPVRGFKSRLWFEILLKMLDTGVTRIASITVQLAAARNHLDFPDVKENNLKFGHVDMSDESIEDIIEGLFKAWMRYCDKNYARHVGDMLDGIAWVDDTHIKRLLKISPRGQIDRALLDLDHFTAAVKKAIKLDELYRDAYGKLLKQTQLKHPEKTIRDLLEDDVKIVDRIGVNLGPLSDPEINAGLRLAEILTRVVLSVYF